MKKSEAINTFAQGLVMDINPLVAPNDGVCNALNATLITMNGNENVLQNDMGNGRVETAFLPEGYVPLGTTELGGIIYIVSYNPLNKKCQIGSFPSPERNISTDKISDLNQTLDNTDFKYNTQTGTQTGALVYYLKKELNEGLTFNPGDKFIVYGDTIDANFANLYDETSYDQSLYNDSLYDQSLSEEEIKKKIQKAIEIIKNHTLKLDIGTVTDTGKLVKFENLKQYNITYKDPTDPTKKIQGKYHIFQYSGEGNQAPNLDEYRSLVSQPYNIFSSKISGSLVLIAELVQFNDFDVQLEHAFTISNEHKVYAPKATFTFSGDYPFIPKGVIGEISLTNGIDPDITSTFEYTIPDSNISSQLSKDNTFYEVKLNQILENIVESEENSVLEKIQEISKDGYFDSGERNKGYVIKYKFTPCMNWGPVSYLSVTGQIDLDKLGTGYIEVNQWRYYNEENKCNLTWGLEIYEEEGHTVDKVTMDFTRFTTPDSTETATYQVNNKSSYFGVFYDVLPIGEDYYRLTRRLKPNCLYLVEIKVDYKSTDKNSSKPDTRTFYRWLYTNTVFNKHYTDTDDFQTLELDFTPNFKINYNNNIGSSSQSKAYGIIRKVVDGLTDEEKETSEESISSLSAIQTKNDSSINGNLSVGLVKDYNTFYLEANKNAFEVTLNETSVNCTSSSDIKYSDREDIYQDEYLKSEGEIVNSDTAFNAYIIGSNPSGNDISGKLKELPTNVIKIEKDAFNTEFKDNIYTFSLSYSSLHTVKAYCTKVISDLTYKGRFIPLAYDTTTFQDYNLEWDTTTNNRWKLFNIGLFGFKENAGHRGQSYIGGWNNTTAKDSDEILIKKQEELDFHWTTDINIPSAQSASGWSGTSMFFLHKWGADQEDHIQNIDDPVNIPQNTGNVYSYPSNITGKCIRIQLSLKSNKEDDFYYPINCSAYYLSNNKIANTGDIINIEKFCNLFNDFAQYLNNIYRYDSGEATQQWIIPKFIYWMDNCKYSLSMSLNVKSNNTLDKDAVVYLMLDEGKLKLSEIITKLKDRKYLENKDYPTLEKNILSNIQNIENSFTINIVDSDNISGIEMRNYMLDCMKPTLSSAIMDYDGTKILANTDILANNKYLYMRNDTAGNPSIALATNFIPKKIHYTKNGSNIITSVDTSDSPLLDIELPSLNMQELNLNRYFTLNDNNKLVLKDPRSTEHKFKRNSGNGKGIIDGYLNLCILYKYKSY